MATLAKNGLLFNFKKSFLDDTIELQLISLIDTKDKGQLNQFKATFNIIDNLSLSFLYYKGKGNRIKYPDITFIDNDGDGINDDFINNNTGRDMPGSNGDGIVDANMINESLLYPFNAMEDFSHIRFQLQYFF